MERVRRTDAVARCMALTLAGVGLLVLAPPAFLAWGTPLPVGRATDLDGVWLLALAMIVTGLVSMGLKLSRFAHARREAEDAADAALTTPRPDVRV